MEWFLKGYPGFGCSEPGDHQRRFAFDLSVGRFKLKASLPQPTVRLT
jgi:hypothetical protein